MTILPKTLLSLMCCHFMAFTFFSAGHELTKSLIRSEVITTSEQESFRKMKIS